MLQRKKIKSTRSFEYNYFDETSESRETPPYFLEVSENKNQTKRTKQLLLAVFLLVVVALLVNEYHDYYPAVLPIYQSMMFMLALCYLIVSLGYLKLGSYIFVWLIYAGITALILNNEGLRNPVTIAYAGNLVFAAMLASRRLFLSLCLMIGFTFLAVGYANANSLIVFDGMSFDFMTAVYLLLIYIVISYGIWTLTGDLRDLVRNLGDEHQKTVIAQQKYQKIAQIDQLTGLPNRVIAIDRFNQSISHAHRDHSEVAMMFLDLDNFKTVNDSLGHTVGDGLLKTIAERLTSSIREGDTVCRIGGDEFLVVLEDIKDKTMIAKIADKILHNVALPIIESEHQLTTTCSIGIAVYPTDGENFDELRKKADTAMYKSKQSGKNNAVFFDDEMNKDMLEHIDNVNSIREAIKNEEFELYYQPKIDLNSGKAFSAEALVRWNRNGEVVGPNSFIPIAEKTGLILEIGEWVLNEACKQCKKFQENGVNDFGVAVNLSSIQFRRGNLVNVVKTALENANLNASYLELEVTESLLMEDSDRLRNQIRELQAIGVTFSIDDFGTGYSSLAYLRDFDFDFIKIDRSFTKNSASHESDLALCEAIVVMAHKLKLMVVAEGIETNEQRVFLKRAGCEFGQGNLFSEPVPAEEFRLRFISECVLPEKTEAIDCPELV
ncbi:MAG: diguanylate cyclase (GGDEF)-like protein [Polaribacter sp.]|jgi:diguanylate cyclase (GGDEF)-like protein